MDSKIIDDILKREGGFVNYKLDRGGATNFGITAKTLGQYRNLGRDASIKEVQDLTVEEAKSIYQNKYIIKPRLDKITYKPLRELLVDSAVNHGPERACKWLQEALGVQADGIIGPMTLSSLDASDEELIRKRILKTRIKFYGEIVSKNPSQVVFLNGWLNRVTEFI